MLVRAGRLYYEKQIENAGGTAFNGGHLEIFTPAWQTALSSENARKQKTGALECVAHNAPW